MNSACKQNSQIIIMHFRLEDVFRELEACTTKKKCLRNANHVNLGNGQVWMAMVGNGCALMSFLSNDSENSQVVYYILLFYTAAFNLIQFIVTLRSQVNRKVKFFFWLQSIFI
jgi:hypothetical protein